MPETTRSAWLRSVLMSFSSISWLGERLAREHGMTVARMDRKRSPSHGVTEEAVDALRRVCDFVVSGIGD